MTNTTSKGSALITGASSGIGAVYADRLARRGFDLILAARDVGRLNALADRLRAATGVQVEVLPADLTDRADLAKVARRLEEDPAITLLVNNAGVGGTGPLVGEDPLKLETLIALNVTAVTLLAHAAANAFAARGQGAIINLASVLGIAPEIVRGAYSATKAYVLTLSQSLHAELSTEGVQIQAVLPGATRTEIWERSGVDVNSLDQSRLMDVEEMVDAALTGFDQLELVTIPSLPDPADWQAFTAARMALLPNLSRAHAAVRYKLPTPA
ncbi:SDR family oxidoreductase [Phenylobacterium aquaticum]|uniref:SDR family NAD(P)-dependent oxidoreductase n=1 Tax=Phenylobacterium aquaticum TaxID=1763816 RepID=UPI0026EBD4CE|nr:SDR family oxidoreductase [Phenylobacterium aquaticum]